MKKIKTLLILIFILSIGTKLFAAYYLGNKFTPRLWEYDTIAMNIINGNGFSFKWDIASIERFGINFRSYLEPFFIILCTVVYYFTKHSTFAVLILQIFYASLIPLAIYYIASRLYDTKVAITSTILSVFAPGILYYSTTNLHYMPLYSLFVCSLILVTFRVFENPCGKNQVLLGVILGISFLTRSTTTFIMAAIFLWLWLNLKMATMKKIDALIKIFIVSAVIIMPWVIRNYCVHKRLVLSQTCDGAFLYMAANPNATGTLYLKDGRYQLEGIPGELLDKHKTLTEIEFRDLMVSEGWRFTRQNPMRALKLSFLKFYYFWWFSPISGKAPGYEYPETIVKLYKLYYTPILSIFLWQVLLIIRSVFRNDSPVLSKELLILLCLLAVTIPHSILYAEGRHRFMIEPLLLIFVSRRLVLWAESLTYQLKKSF